MISAFSVSGFRNLNAEDLKFTRFNLLIGPNNSGKSNFIEALFSFPILLNSGGIGSRLHRLLSRLRWDEQLTRGWQEAREVTLHWRLSESPEVTSENELRYTLTYGVGTRESIPKGFQIRRESLYDGRGDPEEKEEFPLKVECHTEEVGKDTAHFSFQSVVDRGLSIPGITANDTIFNQMPRLLEEPRFYEQDHQVRFQEAISFLQKISRSTQYD